MGEGEGLSVGRILKTRRQSRGVSMEDIAAATRIHKKYLLALEEERFSDLPHLTSAKGFLKIYANYLGLDPVPLLANLKFRGASPLVYPTSVSDPSLVYRKWIFYIALIIIALLFLFSVFYKI